MVHKEDFKFKKEIQPSCRIVKWKPGLKWTNPNADGVFILQPWHCEINIFFIMNIFKKVIFGALNQGIFYIYEDIHNMTGACYLVLH